jgi:hypothetical protein
MKNEDNYIEYNELMKEYKINNLEGFGEYIQDIFKVT